MPALNFQARFAQLVESGEKRQTIRANRKDGKNPKAGQTLHFFVGLRTNGVRRLGKSICLDVTRVVIKDSHTVMVGTTRFAAHNREALASDDGFGSWAEMVEWFRRHHGLPFEGLLISW